MDRASSRDQIDERLNKYAIFQLQSINNSIIPFMAAN